MFAQHILTLDHFLKFSIFFFGSAILSLGLTYHLIHWFKKSHIFADVNARSMHKLPVPIGGGWAIFPLGLVAWLIFYWPINDSPTWGVFFCTLLLALMSWMDDKETLAPLFRLFVHAIAVAIVLLLLPDTSTVFSDHWPLWADRVLTGLCWVWFINLFNFMDGIDGLAGIEIVFICTGFVIIGVIVNFEMPALYVMTVIAGATIGFLWWNWYPAKIILGDVGAISIGFLLGWLLIKLAMNGYLIPALLLPSYFIADASITMLKRILNKEAFWIPHKKHYYQRATMGLNNNHAAPLEKIISANFGLLALAIISLYYPLIAAFCGLLILIFIINILERFAVK